jgi:hypothetical protein
MAGAQDAGDDERLAVDLHPVDVVQTSAVATSNTPPHPARISSIARIFTGHTPIGAQMVPLDR